MADCKCGASVAFVQVSGPRVDDGEEPLVIPLESFDTPAGERYVIVDYATDPWTAEKVDQNSTRVGHADHRRTCPYQ